MPAGRLKCLIAYRPFEIAIMGEDALKKKHQMQQHYLPTALFMEETEEQLPLKGNKGVEEGAFIYYAGINL